MYVRDHKEGATLTVRVIPNASRNSIIWGEDGRLVVKLTAAPVEGRANKELGKFLGKRLGFPPSSLSVIRGRTSRDKVILVAGANPEELEGIIERAL